MRYVKLLATLTLLVSFNACGGGSNLEKNTPSVNPQAPSTLQDTPPVTKLTNDEQKGILLMREEEKLARDVYRELYLIWGSPVFDNIASSEQIHTDLVATLINKYSLEDPIKTDTQGIFTNADFNVIYKKLTSKGKVSLLEGMKVGAYIEDLDIYDLQELLKKTVNEDIKAVYNRLLMGSKNHMRAFYRQITLLGGTYEPQHISSEDFDAIINNP